MRVYQFRHVGIVLLASTADCFTADHNENNALLVVPTKGLEPLHPKAHGPEPCASTNSATWALCCLLLLATTLLRITTINNLLLVVPTKGLEPLHPKAHGPEPCASTNSATWALLLLAACRCVFCSEDKIIRAGGHSVNQHFALFFKKHVFSPEKGCPL